MRRIAILFVSTLAALPAFSQTAPAPAAAAPPAGAVGAAGASGAIKGPHPKSPEENSALLDLFKATDPDAQVKAAEDFMKTYPDTDYKAQVLLVEAEAYNQKRDYPKAIVMGEEALAADPKSYSAMLLLADIYSRTSKVTDLDLNDKLAKAEKYAKQAIADLATAEKPKPELSDADWAAAKAGQESEGWLALGYSAVLRKNFAEAKTNFEKGVSLYPDPLEMLYIERSYAAAKQYDDAIAWDDKALATPNLPDQLKQIATNDKARNQNLKKQAQ